jgi:hypothetical protein
MKTKQAFKKLPIGWMDSDFKDEFYPLPFDPDKKAMLVGTKLPRVMTSQEILKELNPDTDISMEELVGTLETMSHDVWALFYCKDKDGVARLVGAGWDDGCDGWGVYADDVSRSHQWFDEDRLFSRN